VIIDIGYLFEKKQKWSSR